MRPRVFRAGVLCLCSICFQADSVCHSERAAVTKHIESQTPHLPGVAVAWSKGDADRQDDAAANIAT